MIVLGISALYHDSAAAIVKDGEILAAAQEERFTRKKHDLRLPVNAIKYCLETAEITMDGVDWVVYYDDPMLTLERYLNNILALGSEAEKIVKQRSVSLFAEKMWIHNSLREVFGKLGKQDKLLTCRHHISHAASAFYPSPYEEAAILTIDGVGEYTTTAFGVGKGNKISLIGEIDYPHSLGLLYSAFTYYCGFKVNSGDYKLMGLAPYGEPKYVDIIKEKLIDIKDDGSYRLNLEYFDFYRDEIMTSEKFDLLFGGKRREPESVITKREMDLAASVQKVLEEVVFKLAQHVFKVTGKTNLVMAGGVALNCVANGKLLKNGPFENIWVQPAAGDAGGALGAALYAYYSLSGEKRIVDPLDSQKGSFLGPSFGKEYVEEFLTKGGYPFKSYSNEELYGKIAELLDDQKIIGLCIGRMEFGPRALGHRSIIGDARSPKMQADMNLKIKYRESFRPFAPAVLAEDADEYFDLGGKNSPYMLICADVVKDRQKAFNISDYYDADEMDMLPIVNVVRSDIPAVTHVDYSARVQTVTADNAPDFYGIIQAFKALTGSSVLINTSFNVRGEPIVCTPQDAYLCFMRTDMDALVLDNCLLLKEEQPQLVENSDWRKQYELD